MVTCPEDHSVGYNDAGEEIFLHSTIVVATVFQCHDFYCATSQILAVCQTLETHRFTSISNCPCKILET
jgi:hypothetical protein